LNNGCLRSTTVCLEQNTLSFKSFYKILSSNFQCFETWTLWQKHRS